MKVAVDTNVLVRAVVQDETSQARIAAKLLTEAELIAVTLPCLCESVISPLCLPPLESARYSHWV
jgi:predicted nucleic-acid-binding protein